MAVVGIVAAAGSGERLGAEVPKALVPCAGRALLDWSIDVLAQVCERVVAAVPAGYEDGRARVLGGPSRSASVALALAAMPEASVVVVHDAARPLVSRELVERCIAGLDGGFEGAVAAAPMTDTVKEAGAEGRVLRTLERARLWRVQTPQAFRATALRSALAVDEDVLARATDDAGLVEAAGGAVRVVEAPAENVKITSPLDLELAELVLLRRGMAPPPARDERC